ncbi:type I secretion protein TolC [Methylovorus sp. MM2]|uniref:TolC family outer membrane protein n=1 Tax=Methylovorus sp. MM2 TaxID=1848038 RepID=UPI0007DFBBA8|nr:TolC family outer membrane protein [Methylovorus sp. MM2]OAM52101.1 type I secretion protein TolC [Methylovorus sp. MM2]
MYKKVLTIALVMLWSNVQAENAQNLLDIYQLALSNDPVWASARSGNLAAQEKVAQGKALYLPTATFSTNASHSDSDIRYINNSVFRNGGRESYETFGYGVNVSQPIFRMQNYLQYQQSKIQVSQADKQLILAQQDLILRTAQAYFDVLLAQDKIDLINAQKSAISRQLEQAQANFDVGTATITDVNEAQAKFDLTTAQEIATINDLEIKKRTIQSIIGQLPQALATAKADIKTELPEPRAMQQWVEIAEQNNLALNIQQEALQIATKEVDRQNAGHLPTLDAVGNYNDTRAGGSPNGFGSDLQNTTIGLQLQIPLYQGGAINSKVREAVANKQKAQDDVETARRKAELDTQQAYLNLTSSISQVKAYEQALISSQSQLDSTNLGYDVGVRNSVDVLNAQQQLFSAKRDLLQSRYTYLLSALKLKSASGLLNDLDLVSINQQLVNAPTQP